MMPMIMMMMMYSGECDDGMMMIMIHVGNDDVMIMHGGDDV